MHSLSRWLCDNEAHDMCASDFNKCDKFMCLCPLDAVSRCLMLLFFRLFSSFCFFFVCDLICIRTQALVSRMNAFTKAMRFKMSPKLHINHNIYTFSVLIAVSLSVTGKTIHLPLNFMTFIFCSPNVVDYVAALFDLSFSLPLCICFIRTNTQNTRSLIHSMLLFLCLMP